MITLKKFVIDTPQVIKSTVLREMWASSIIHSDANHHVPVQPAYYKYLTLQVKQKTYWFKVCTFCFSLVFT